MAIFDRVFVVQNEQENTESLPGTHLVQKRLDDARIKNTRLKSLFHEHTVCQQKLNKIKRRKNTQWTNTELTSKTLMIKVRTENEDPRKQNIPRFNQQKQADTIRSLAQVSRCLSHSILTIYSANESVNVQSASSGFNFILQPTIGQSSKRNLKRSTNRTKLCRRLKW